MQFSYANQYPSAYSSAPQQLQQQQPPPPPPPYGFGMQPTIQMQPIVIPLVQTVNYAHRRAITSQLFKEKYPRVVSLVFAFLIAGASSLLIAMQIEFIKAISVTRASNGYSGFWAGAMGLLFVLTIVTTALSKSYCVFIVSTILNAFTAFAFFVATTLNAIASYSTYSTQDSSSSNYFFTTTTTKAASTSSSSGSNLSTSTIKIVLIVASAVGFVLSFAFFITISCVVGPGRGRRFRSVGMTAGAQMAPTAAMQPYGQAIPINSNSMPIATQQQQQQQNTVYANQFNQPTTYY